MRKLLHWTIFGLFWGVVAYWLHWMNNDLPMAIWVLAYWGLLVITAIDLQLWHESFTDD